MRILIFNTYYYPKFVGGAEISVQLLAEGLVKEGHNVFVITFGLIPTIDRVNGVIVIRLKQQNIYAKFNDEPHNRMSKMIWHIVDSCNPFYRSQISAIIKKIQPDVVHTNNIQGFSPSVWSIIKDQKIPLVHTIRDYYLLCHRNNMFNNNSCCATLCGDCRLTQSIKKNYTSLPDCFVGISNYILNRHSSVIDDSKIKAVVYNGVNINNNLVDQVKTTKLVLGYMGRISQDKGIEYLITELLTCDTAAKQKIKLIIAGKGEINYINHLKNLADGLNIEFVGVVKPEHFYSKVQVLVVPSLWPEPFGRTVIEALSFNTPVCIAENGGLTELHNEKCTWLFKPEKGELRNLIEKLVVDKNIIAVKKRRCQECVTRFSENNYVENYLHIYNKTVLAKSTFSVTQQLT
jgi:glycosyltransferase involved in cell wall biosynthesis